MKQLFLFALIALTLASCSKQAKLERNLFKKGGEWSISSYKATEYDNGTLVYDEVFTNCGTFIFEKDGSGSYSITAGAWTDTGTMRWSNDEKTVTIDGDTFEVLKNEKNTIVLHSEYTDNSSGTPYEYHDTFELQRK